MSQSATVDRPAVWWRRLSSGQAGLLVVLLTFVVLYGWLLIATDFLPYVTDNNESFSSLWHAHNLYNFNFFESAGLTDEASSPHAEAHPFVHTHQGNVPRLFAFLIYVLGARTVESQIALTTLIVGTGAVAVAYRLFWRLVGPLFATVACLTLITDYLYFGQWAVVTYRIWHFLFVFGTLLCAYEMRGKAFRRWAGVTVLLFALVFYYELVFAGFTAVFAGLFAGWQHRWQIKRLALVWTAQVTGAVIGVGVLVIQLTAHFGGDVALEDFYLTFVARNAAASDPELQKYMTEFFLSHHIVFWQNIVDVRTFRTFEQFVVLLTTQHVQWYTPLIGLLSAMLLVGWVAGLGGDALTGWLQRQLGGGSASDDGPAPVISAAAAEWSVVVVSVLGFATALLAVTLFGGEAFLGLPFSGTAITEEQGLVGWLLIAVVLGVVAVAGWNGAWSRRLVILNIAGVSPARVALAATMLLGSVLAIRGQSVLYQESYEPLWNGIMQQTVPIGVSRAGSAILLGLAAVLALAGPRRVLGRARADQLRGILPYVLCGAVAYTTVYMISPGYVLSGYLSRFAPLAVFVLDIPLAIAAYLVIGATIRAVERLRQLRTRGLGTAPLVAPAVRAGLMVGGLTFLVGFWLQVQVAAIWLLPPNAAAFMKLLGEPPLRGSSLFSNTYIAPLTTYTGEWGYIDASAGQWKVEATDIGYFITRGEREGEYVWLRDARTNPAYARPDLYVCFQPPNVYSTLKVVTGKLDEFDGCSSYPIVENAADGTQEYFHNEIIARDPSPLDAWAIVRMDWENPPFLFPLGDGPARRFVDVDRIDIGDQLTLRIRYEYRHQDDIPERGTRVQLEGVRQDGMVCTLMERTDVTTLVPGNNMRGRVRVVVTPSTATKAGPRYESARFILGRDSNVDPCRGRNVRSAS